MAVPRQPPRFLPADDPGAGKTIMTNDSLEAARTGNWFLESPLPIYRLDQLAAP